MTLNRWTKRHSEWSKKVQCWTRFVLHLKIISFFFSRCQIKTARVTRYIDFRPTELNVSGNSRTIRNNWANFDSFLKTNNLVTVKLNITTLTAKFLISLWPFIWFHTIDPATYSTLKCPVGIFITDISVLNGTSKTSSLVAISPSLRSSKKRW